MTWTAPEYPRTDEPFTGPERPMLDGFLDWYRASFLRRCTGLTGEQLTERSAPPSGLSGQADLIRERIDGRTGW
jgi:hypothetical protein